MNITQKKVFVDIIQVSSKEESFVMIENSCVWLIRPQHKYKQAIDDPPATTIVQRMQLPQIQAQLVHITNHTIVRHIHVCNVCSSKVLFSIYVHASSWW